MPVVAFFWKGAINGKLTDERGRNGPPGEQLRQPRGTVSGDHLSGAALMKEGIDHQHPDELLRHTRRFLRPLGTVP